EDPAVRLPGQGRHPRLPPIRHPARREPLGGHARLPDRRIVCPVGGVARTLDTERRRVLHQRRHSTARNRLTPITTIRLNKLPFLLNWLDRCRPSPVSIRKSLLRQLFQIQARNRSLLT